MPLPLPKLLTRQILTTFAHNHQSREMSTLKVSKYDKLGASVCARDFFGLWNFRDSSSIFKYPKLNEADANCLCLLPKVREAFFFSTMRRITRVKQQHTMTSPRLHCSTGSAVFFFFKLQVWWLHLRSYTASKGGLSPSFWTPYFSPSKLRTFLTF